MSRLIKFKGVILLNQKCGDYLSTLSHTDTCPIEPCTGRAARGRPGLRAGPGLVICWSQRAEPSRMCDGLGRTF